jgi:hypothetical protein
MGINAGQPHPNDAAAGSERSRHGQGSKRSDE